MVTVSKDGPYHITGGIELIGGDANNIMQFGDGASKEHYTLRCRASKNKPFCDGMHKVINFKDDKKLIIITSGFLTLALIWPNP